MRELLRSNDLVRLSFLSAVLSDAGIETITLDSHTSFAQGSLDILPRRLMVSSLDYDQAVRILREVGEWSDDAGH